MIYITLILGFVMGFGVGWLSCMHGCRLKLKQIQTDYNARLSTLYNEVKKLRKGR